MDGYVFKERPFDALKSGQWKNVPTIAGSVSGDKDLHVGREEVLKAMGLEAATAPFMGDTFVGLRQSDKDRIPAYVYYFDPYIPEHDVYHFVEDGLAYHSAELWYIFGTLARCWRDFDGRHYDLSRLMIQYWTNFARTGDPNSEGLPEWKTFSKETPEEMYFNENGSGTRKVQEFDAFLYVWEKGMKNL